MKGKRQRAPRWAAGLVALSLVLTLIPLAGPIPVSADTTVFINEIHYDNTGADTGEAVEVAGPAGTDLTDWTLALYNGSGGALYDTFPLSGVIPDQDNGHGTLSFARSGIQNGSPDGLALVDAASNVVQFLSYEGTFTAVDGPAAGSTSTDIGVSEPSDTAIGDSLQLTGTGSAYEDFTWSGPTAKSFGAVNTGAGQSFGGGGGQPVLVINEIDYDQPGTDTAEFVEIKNVGTAAAGLGTVTLELVNGTSGGATLYQSFTLPDVSLAAGDYFVVCANAATVPNCDLDVSPDSNLIQNGAPDAVGLLMDGVLVDAVSYEGDSGAPYTEGSGIGLEDDPGVDYLGISRFPDGADTDQNNADLSPRCITPGEANTEAATGCVKPGPPLLVINEIDYDQPSTDTAEFVEIKNVGPDTVNLSGIELLLVNGSTDLLYGTIALPDVSLAAGDYYVVCGNAANVPNCDLDVAPDTNLIQNGAPDAVALRAGGMLIDAVSYEGDTGAPYTEGSGSGLEDDSSQADVGISRCPDGTDTDQNNADLSLQAITPGAANSCVVPVPELVINEIDYDQPGTDAAEFVEIKNVGTAAANLGGVELVLVNGNGTSIYNTIPLPGISLAAGDYFVVCANAATVPNCDLDASPDTNFIQNGAPDAVALLFGGSDILDAVSYEGDTGAPYTEGSGAGLVDTGAPGMGISRCPDGIDTDVNNVDLGSWPISPGAANICETCADPFTPAYEIQGSDAASSYDGTVVSVQGVVTGDFQGSEKLNGFFIQDAAGDGNAATSDGLFVYAPGVGDVAVGDLVRVRGEVDEYYDLTEITDVDWLLPCGTGQVAATAVSLPLSAGEDWERYEGMLVTFLQELAATESYDVHRYGEVVLSAGGRQFNPTNYMAPGPGAADSDGDSVADVNEPGRIILDDASTDQFPPTVPYIAPDGTLRLGDSVSNLTGVLSYGFDEYRIQPTQSFEFVRANPRTAPADVGGTIKVASFNTLNYWTTIHVGGNDARGADSEAELARQRAKTVAAILGLDADVVGLQELENNGEVAIGDLVAALNGAPGSSGTWAAVPDPDYPGGLPSTNAIKVGLIYRTDRVIRVGDSVADDDPAFAEDRPPVAQTFDAEGEVFTVVVNHFKSKGCGEATGLDLDQGDGQGCYNARRVQQAGALLDFVAALQTASADDDVVVLGDLNAYAMEDPIATLGGGLANQMDAFLSQEAQYSYTYFGQTGLLDHLFTTDALAGRATGVDIWHINADEPRVLDYNDEVIDPAEDYRDFSHEYLYKPDQYRSSDHDPVIFGFCDAVPPVVEVTVSPDMLWPPMHQYVTVSAEVTAVDNFDPQPVVTLVSVESNEPDDGLGDGDMADDIVVLDDYTFDLRAERSGTGEGRIYTITYEVTDACGNTTVASATVTVPHDRSR